MPALATVENPSPVWYAITTAPQFEARVIDRLRPAGVTCYAPMARMERRVGRERRREEFTRPLFARYVFVALDAMRPAWGRVLAVPGVSGFVSIDAQPLRIPGAAIERLRNDEAMGRFDFRRGARPVSLAIGDGVVLQGGALDGELATVELVPNRRNGRVVVSIGTIRLKLPLDAVRLVA